MLSRLAHRRDWTVEQAQDDFVVDDEHRPEVRDRLPSRGQFGHGRLDPTIELAKVVLPYPGPEALRDVAVPDRPGHAWTLGSRGPEGIRRTPTFGDGPAVGNRMARAVWRGTGWNAERLGQHALDQTEEPR